MKTAESDGLDALSKDAQQPFVASCVAFSCAFLEHGESYFPDSAVLATFRQNLGADLGSFSEHLWRTRPPADDTRKLMALLEATLEAHTDLPSGVDKFDGHTVGALLIVMTACAWVLGEEPASTVARMTTDFLDEIATQEALAATGRKTMLYDDIDPSAWVGPEQEWQAHYVAQAQHQQIDALERMARVAAQGIVAELIPKINAVIRSSRL